MTVTHWVMEAQSAIKCCTYDDVMRKLQACGITPTRQRVQIAQVLFSRCEHLSADQVLAAVNAREALASKATVYNTLNLFVRMKLVREVLVDTERVFYDPNTAPHHHFYNVDTGEISDIAADHIAFAQLPDLPQGMVSDGVDVVVRIRAAATSD
jgi:Fur family transcriptional regulator, iron response regulator